MLIPDLVTVVITVFEREAALSYALQSLFWQTYSNWEALVYSDGPSPQSRQILDSVMQQYPSAASRIQYQEHIAQPGRFGNHLRRQGALDASGALLTYLSHDCFYHPEFLSTHVEMQRDKPCVSVTQVDYWRARDDHWQTRDFSTYVGVMPTKDVQMAELGQIDAHCLVYPTERVREQDPFKNCLEMHAADFVVFDAMRRELPVEFRAKVLSSHM